MHCLNFTEQQKEFCLCLHYNELNSFIFFNSDEIYKVKAENSEIDAVLLCLDNVLKDFFNL